MGKINILCAFVHHQVVWPGVLCVLLLQCVFLSSAQANAIKGDGSTFILKLPDAMKVTESEALSRVRHWQEFIESVRHKSETDMLVAVNNYFNAMQFREDITLWHTTDYWATPLQVLVAGAGDCEDFAIAKYFTLMTLGVANEHLRITYVLNHATTSGNSEAHMVLTYAKLVSDEPLVLDILTNEIHTLKQRKELEPMYSLNSEGLWLVGDNAKSIFAGSPAQLPEWRRLSQAMGNDAAWLRIH